MFPVGSQALHVASFPSPSAAARCRATPAPSPASSRLASVRLGPARAGSVPARLVSNGPRLSDVAFESGARPGPGGRAGPHPIKGCFGSGPKRAAPGSGPAPGGEVESGSGDERSDGVWDLLVKRDPHPHAASPTTQPPATTPPHPTPLLPIPRNPARAPHRQREGTTRKPRSLSRAQPPDLRRRVDAGAIVEQHLRHLHVAFRCRDEEAGSSVLRGPAGGVAGSDGPVTGGRGGMAHPPSV
jgi:hypothetical protein